MANPTFSAVADLTDPLWSTHYPVTAITGHPYISHVANLAVFNKSGSGKVVKILRATCSSNAARSTSTYPAFAIQRCSAAVEGDGYATIIKLDSSNDSLPSQVKAYRSPDNATLTASTVLIERAMIQTTSTTASFGLVNGATHRPLSSMFEWMGHSDLQKEVLREGEGVAIHTSGNVVYTSAFEVTIRFRKASNGHTYQVRETFRPNGCPLLVLMNESSSGVVLEVTKIVVQEQGDYYVPYFSPERIDSIDENTGVAATYISLGGESLPSGVVVRRRCRIQSGDTKFGAIIPSCEFAPRLGTCQPTGPGITDGWVGGLAGQVTTHFGIPLRSKREPRYEMIIREGEGFAWLSKISGGGMAFALGLVFTVEDMIPKEDDVRDGVYFGVDDQYEGDLVLPVESDVKTGVGYGADGTEYTGTYSGGGGGSGMSKGRVVNQ